MASPFLNPLHDDDCTRPPDHGGECEVPYRRPVLINELDWTLLHDHNMYGRCGDRAIYHPVGTCHGGVLGRQRFAQLVPTTRDGGAEAGWWAHLADYSDDGIRIGSQRWFRDYDDARLWATRLWLDADKERHMTKETDDMSKAEPVPVPGATIITPDNRNTGPIVGDRDIFLASEPAKVFVEAVGSDSKYRAWTTHKTDSGRPWSPDVAMVPDLCVGAYWILYDRKARHLTIASSIGATTYKDLKGIRILSHEGLHGYVRVEEVE